MGALTEVPLPTTEDLEYTCYERPQEEIGSCLGDVKDPYETD